MNVIKRYDTGCAYAGEEEMVISSDGQYVTYSDYAELQRKVEALTGENAEMKRLASEAYDEMESHYDTDGLHSVDADGEQMDALIRLCDAQSTCEKLGLMETPATDAALAEIRAQGVDGAIDTIMVHMNHQHVAVKEALHIITVYSNQLRKEAGHD